MLVISRFFAFFLFLLISSSGVFSRIQFRTFSDASNTEEIFVSIDFKLSENEHITAPMGKGSEIAPSITWENADVLDVSWPMPDRLSKIQIDLDEYLVYKQSFSVIYKLKKRDINSPISYQIFYTVCSDSCIPFDESGNIEDNGLLSKDEVCEFFRSKQGPSDVNLFMMIIFGFLGGFVLNFMPCVFPIISMKVFSIVRLANQARSIIQKQAIATSSGIIITFLGIFAVLSILRKSISGIGWGFYMQSSVFVLILFILFLLCALHFWGIFHFQLLTLRRIRLPVKNIYVSSFFSGVFSGIASSSCVGPFAGIALAGALLYGTIFQSFMIFTALGIGLATPFLLISFFPNFVTKFPKPGRWLHIFKEFMGFAMLASCLWPVSVLMAQLPADKFIKLLLSLVSLVTFLWMLKTLRKSKLSSAISLFGIVLSLLLSFENVMDFKTNNSEEIIWQDYSSKLLEDYKLSGKPIFLNFTAVWCMNCKFNQRIFSDTEIIKAFNQKDIKPIKCDWTNRNPEVADLMSKYGAVAVPFYVYYPGNNKDFIILPNFLSKKDILEVIKETEK